MLHALIQSLSQFMQFFVMGALVAGACSAFAYMVNMETPGCAGLLGSMCLLLSGMFLSPAVFLAALFCVPGAFARKAARSTRTSTLVFYLDLLTTTFLSLAIGTVIIYFASASRWGDWGLSLGLTSTPSAFPIFRWLWRTSKTRPGLDRHLTADETHPPR